MPIQQRQQGITLIVCMIVLTVLTMLGLSSIRDTTLEEKMAGNMRNRNLAFQAAESALREAENFIETTRALPDFNNTAGLYEQMSEMWPTSAASWGISTAVSRYGSTLPGIAATPVYIIERMDSEVKLASAAAGRVQSNQTFYRITARAVGSTDAAVVILQSTYRR